MPTHYLLRVQTRPELTPSGTADRLVGIARETGADEICLFAFSEERNTGHPTLDEVRHWCEHTAPARRALAETGVRVSVNPWLTLLHADRGRRLRPDQPWQRLVDPDGRTAEAQVCPLDPGWRAYYRDVLRTYAGAGEVELVWIEDDIRLHNHAPLRWGGCFCPLHLARFAERAGRPVGREELVAACTAAGTPHPWRAAWLDTWDEAQLELVEQWRGALPPGVRLGLMSSLLSQHAAEGRRWPEWFRALDPGGAPVHRPHFWPYQSATPQVLPEAVVQLDATRATQPAGVRSLPEIENAPYGRWNKSFRETFAQEALAHVLGSSGLAVSVHDFLGNDPDDEPEKTRFLRRVRPALDRLAELFPPGWRTTGVVVPWSADARQARLPAGAGWEALQIPVGGFGRWLATAGIAVTLREPPGGTVTPRSRARPGGGVRAVCGPAAWAADDRQIESWLAGGALLSGPAALALHSRGYADLVGLSGLRPVTQAETGYSFERCVDPGFGLRAGADIGVNLAGPGSYCDELVQGRPVAGARARSVLLDGHGEPVGHGLVTYRNRLGGRVAVLPWRAESPVVMNEQRAAQLVRTLDWLAGGAPGHLVASGHPWLVPVVLADPAGERWRAAVFNAGPDDATGFTMRLPPDLRPVAACQVTGSGEFVSAELTDGGVRTGQPLRQWELVILSPDPLQPDRL